MVLVLGYNNSETKFLNMVLEENNIKYKYSLLEPQITKAEKIILPHPVNFSSTYRRMNMMNLFSLLRIVKKPILGINNGFSLMCNQLIDHSKCGLGFFNLDINIGNEILDSNNFVSGKLDILKDCKLLSNNLQNQLVKFNLGIQSLLCQYSCATISYKQTNYSLIYECENYYAVQIDFERNQEVGREIIKNFLKL